jgi:2Fe-2S ferredoxin
MGVAIGTAGAVQRRRREERRSSMVRIHYVEPNGVQRSVELEIGQTLMQGAVKSGIKGIVAECGGACVCATCHVYFDERYMAAVAPSSATESEMLDAVASERLPNSRLSCQIKASDAIDGAVVRLPPVQL